MANATVDADPDGKQADNLDVLFDPSGEIVDTYSKRHLVPFGEYVPLRSSLQPLIPALDKVPRDFKPGNRSPLFDIAGVPRRAGHLLRVGVRIPGATARARRRADARGVDEQPLVPAVGELGPACGDRPDARRRDRPAAGAGCDLRHLRGRSTPTAWCTDRRSLFDRTVLETTVAATTGQTPYVRYGEWVIFGSLALVVVAVVIALVRRRRKPSLDLTAHENVSINSRIAGYAGIDVSENGDATEPEPARRANRTTTAPAPSE